MVVIILGILEKGNYKLMGLDGFYWYYEDDIPVHSFGVAPGVATITNIDEHAGWSIYYETDD